MNEYLFYIKESEMTSPDAIADVDNCNYQVLGREQGHTRKDALKTLLNHNPWLELNGIPTSKIIIAQTLTKSQHKDISEVIDYLWRDEEHHYEECDPKFRREHIFNTLIRLREMLG